MEFRQGDKDPSKAAATVARPEESADLGHRMQGQWVQQRQELVKGKSLPGHLVYIVLFIHFKLSNIDNNGS